MTALRPNSSRNASRSCSASTLNAATSASGPAAATWSARLHPRRELRAGLTLVDQLTAGYAVIRASRGPEQAREYVGLPTRADSEQYVDIGVAAAP